MEPVDKKYSTPPHIQQIFIIFMFAIIFNCLSTSYHHLLVVLHCGNRSGDCRDRVSHDCLSRPDDGICTRSATRSERARLRLAPVEGHSGRRAQLSFALLFPGNSLQGDKTLAAKESESGV